MPDPGQYAVEIVSRVPRDLWALLDVKTILLGGVFWLATFLIILSSGESARITEYIHTAQIAIYSLLLVVVFGIPFFVLIYVPYQHSGELQSKLLEANSQLAPFKEAESARIEALKRLPSSIDFDSWAYEFAKRRPEASSPIRAATSSAFNQANAQGQPVYQQFVDTLVKALTAYKQKAPHDIYRDLPPIPSNVFASEMATYRGTVIFSRYWSWYVHVKARADQGGRQGPTLAITLMNGDGHVQGASEVGSLELLYDFEQGQVQFKTSGRVADLLKTIPKSEHAGDIQRVSGQIGKLLIEDALSHNIPS